MLRNGQICTAWSAGLAYVVGLITSDGNLSPDGRHLNITSKDLSLLEAAKEILKIGNTISRKARASSYEKKYFALQFGSVAFYTFLQSIGLTPAKSKTLGSLNIPDEYFAEFLRGCIDGDGSITESVHPESNHLQLRVTICSASVLFLEWLHTKIYTLFSTTGGWITTSESNRCSLLRFGKADSIKILRNIYRNEDLYRLDRKFSVAEKYLDETVIICDTI